MAVIFNPIGEDTEGGITIGGSGDAPFPKYSVSTERVEAADGTIIDIIYTISVTGQIIAVGDMTTIGARQGSLHTAMIAKLAALENDGPVGILEIVPYGGANALTFDDAKLTGISFDEQDDESAGTQVGGYTFEFIAHKRSSTKTGSPYSLASAEETWDITENPERYFVDNEFTTEVPILDDSGNPTGEYTTRENFAAKTYTITHTVSAVGYNKITAVEGKEFDSGWAQAKDWVLGRLVTSPANTITDNVAGNNRFTAFSALYMSEAKGEEILIDDESQDPKEYGPPDPLFIDLSNDSPYNHSRTAQSDLPGGSYSVTETWYMSEEAVTLDVDLALDTGEDGVTSITVSGGIQGYNTSSFATRTEDKITQAENALGKVLDQAYGLANIFYKASVPSTTECPAALSTSEMSKSISKNKITGAITYSLSYNDRGSESPNTITENLQITDDNEDQLNNVVAIIQIIGRANGPIFQDMGTTTERKRSASLEWTMKRCNRASKPSAEALLVMEAHKPVALTPVYQLSKSESWTPSTGGYSLSIEWAY